MVTAGTETHSVASTGHLRAGPSVHVEEAERGDDGARADPRADTARSAQLPVREDGWS